MPFPNMHFWEYTAELWSTWYSLVFVLVKPITLQFIRTCSRPSQYEPSTSRSGKSSHLIMHLGFSFRGITIPHPEPLNQHFLSQVYWIHLFWNCWQRSLESMVLGGSPESLTERQSLLSKRLPTLILKQEPKTFKCGKELGILQTNYGFEWMGINFEVVLLLWSMQRINIFYH